MNVLITGVAGGVVVRRMGVYGGVTIKSNGRMSRLWFG